MRFNFRLLLCGVSLCAASLISFSQVVFADTEQAILLMKRTYEKNGYNVLEAGFVDSMQSCKSKMDADVSLFEASADEKYTKLGPNVLLPDYSVIFSSKDKDAHPSRYFTCGEHKGLTDASYFVMEK